MRKVLVVDDEAFIREILYDRLTEEGYAVFCAERAELGLTLVEKHSPHVVILDLAMPQMNGIEFLKQLPPRPLTAMSVIVLTGYGSNEAVAQCYRLGIQAFLRKPINFYELHGLVQRAFALKEAMEAKEKAYRLLKKTFDSMGEGVVTLDEYFHIRMISQKTCRMLDLVEADALGKPAASILGAQIAGPTGVLMQHVQKKPNATEVSTQILCPSGAIIPVSLSISPLDDEGADKGWLLLFRDLRQEERLRLDNPRRNAFGSMISCDPSMQEVFRLIEKVAPSNATVLIEGESGTGKELTAQEIHNRSFRAQASFHAVNCAAISANLLESEFFGHERGAFTGAHQAKPGRFEVANHGTLFLDEVSEIPLELQGKLLRALQEQVFERVGGTRKIKVDVRIITASNKPLKRLVEEGKFREDLYYRLHVVPIQLPPLRERCQDIPLLVSAFIEEFNRRERREVRTAMPKVQQKMVDYAWPGNIRELYHMIEYAFAVSTGTILHPQHFPTLLEHTENNVDMSPPPQNERELILLALQKANFNKSKAAALLGINRSTLYRKRQKYEI